MASLAGKGQAQTWISLPVKFIRFPELSRRAIQFAFRWSSDPMKRR